ncbi:MAG TPA: cytochrome c3 family protein [Bacteroidota bacterium]|nr:cytochrome c3 family protein [Bacteroidota bacterium]
MRLHSTPHGVAQPIAFNHKVHIETASLNCKDCHLNVETMAKAAIPTLEVCQTCHNDEPISKAPEEKLLLQYVAEKKEIPWIQVYTVPEQVYFSHRRHVAIAGLGCSSCHGNVAALTTPVSYQEMPVTMEQCMSCHKQHKVTNDCLACHR